MWEKSRCRSEAALSAKSSLFTPETFRFFRELGRNNHKEWMDANRERYQAHVVAPFRALLDRLTPVAHKLNPEFEVGGRTGKNFSRINRDIRFARDKSPYRTQMYLMFSDQRAPEGDDGQLYVGVATAAVTAGFRIYGNTRSRLKQMAAPRAVQNEKWLARQARRLGRRYESYWYATEKGEWTKKNGWPTKPEHWKRLKGWIVRRKMSPAAATRPDFVAEITRVFREVFPLYRFTSAPGWKA